MLLDYIGDWYYDGRKSRGVTLERILDDIGIIFNNPTEFELFYFVYMAKAQEILKEKGIENPFENIQFYIDKHKHNYETEMSQL